MSPCPFPMTITITPRFNEFAFCVRSCWDFLNRSRFTNYSSPFVFVSLDSSLFKGIGQNYLLRFGLRLSWGGTFLKYFPLLQVLTFLIFLIVLFIVRWSLPSTFDTFQVIPVGWGYRIHRLLLCRGLEPPKECPGYDIKQTDGEVPVMLKLWGMQSTPSFTLLPGPP